MLTLDMCDLRDVVPWSLIYGKLNEQNAKEQKATAFKLLEYLVCHACSAALDLIPHGDPQDFVLFCWQQVKQHLTADDIVLTWLPLTVDRWQHKFEYEDLNRGAVNQIQRRTTRLITLLNQ